MFMIFKGGAEAYRGATASRQIEPAVVRIGGAATKICCCRETVNHRM